MLTSKEQPEDGREEREQVAVADQRQHVVEVDTECECKEAERLEEVDRLEYGIVAAEGEEVDFY